MEGGYDRRKRVRRLKKIILGTIFAAIIIPVITSIYLGVSVTTLKQKVKELEEALSMEGEKKKDTDADTANVFAVLPIEETARNMAQAGQFTEEEGADVGPDIDGDLKQIYLTFDDGPSQNTDRILDILKEYDVKATFFVVGKTDEHSQGAYQRIVEEGHTLAMHSYSHKYDEIYETKESFVEDLTKLQEYLYEVTGVRSKYYRFPGGSSNTVSKVDMQELIDYLDENEITYFDWNVSSGDASSKKLDVDTIVENCTGKMDGFHVCMVLMHDAKDKNSTVDALPEVIKKIQDRGDAVFLPVTDETKPVQHVRAMQ